MVHVLVYEGVIWGMPLPWKKFFASIPWYLTDVHAVKLLHFDIRCEAIGRNVDFGCGVLQDVYNGAAHFCGFIT